MTSLKWQERPGQARLEATLGEIRSIVQTMLDFAARFVALVVNQTRAGDLRLAWHWDLNGKLYSVESTSHLTTPLPTIADIYCGADWAEREAREYYAVTFEGRASTLPLMLPEGDPPGLLLRHPGGQA